MRIETTETSVKLIEATEQGTWLVRWDMKKKLNPDGTGTGSYWYEQEVFNHIPMLEDIRRIITDWHNKQVDGAILNAFEWQGMRVWLSMENQFNYKSVFDLAAMTEPAIVAWDINHPELAGKTYVMEDARDGQGGAIKVPVPTGRPQSVLPIAFKFGSDKESTYHMFNTLEELTEFYTATLAFVQGCYQSGWTRKDTFDFTPYKIALDAL